MAKTTSITKSALARIQSATAKANDGITPKNSFASRAQRGASINNSSKGGK